VPCLGVGLHALPFIEIHIWGAFIASSDFLVSKLIQPMQLKTQYNIIHHTVKWY